MNINIRSIKAFSEISDLNLKIIEREAEYLKYPLGYPICNNQLIPNKIQIIISGEVRFLHGTSQIAVTISKLGSDNFIGLSSLLRAKGCESFSASSDVVTLALSDNLILKLYKEEESYGFID